MAVRGGRPTGVGTVGYSMHHEPRTLLEHRLRRVPVMLVPLLNDDGSGWHYWHGFWVAT